MSEQRIHLQPAFVLQAKAHRESSVIVDALTQDFGRITLLAKGARKAKSHLAALLQPFIPLHVSYTGRGEMKILTHAETMHANLPLHGISVYCGFYVNELLQHFLYKNDPHADVFLSYNRCLLALAGNTALEQALRSFELELLLHTGYGLQFDVAADNGAPILPAKRYGFVVEHGAFEDSGGPFSGATLLAVHTNNLAGANMAETKKLLRLAIDHHLSGKQLKSRAFMAQIFNINRSERH